MATAPAPPVVLKSPADTRTFSLHATPTGVAALLVSDADADREGAAVAVSVGYFSDPAAVPGLAHFLEHMLFMGSEKYPVENDFEQHLAQCGGMHNAYTADEATVYMFDVVQGKLKGALDRFAQFFVAPLLTEGATDRELRAVDSEHAKNLQSDAWRLLQLERSTSSGAFPYSKFATGSRETLEAVPKANNVNVRALLEEMHRTHYNAQRERLVVVGRASVEELARMVDECFARVPAAQALAPTALAVPPTFPGTPFPAPTHVARRFWVASVKDIRSLTVAFPLPAMEWGSDAFVAVQVASHLLGHEGSGSIVSLLKAKNWANSLTAGVGTDTTHFAMFDVSIELTEEGVKNLDEITDAVFAYGDMLASRLKADARSLDWVHEELKEQLDAEFRFAPKPKTFMFVREVAANMLRTRDLTQILTIRRVLPNRPLDASFLLRVLETVFSSPAAANVTLAIKDPEAASLNVGGRSQPLEWKTETWYGTKYAVEPLALQRRLSADDRAKLVLPAPNAYIPTDFALVGGGSDESENAADARRPPSLARGTPSTLRCWYKRDNTFKRPRASVVALLRAPAAYSSPRASVLAELVCMVARQFLAEETYAAEVAGLGWSFANSVRGFVLSVSGFNHKLGVLLNKIMDAVTNPQTYADAAILERQVDLLLRSLQNFSKEAPYGLAMYESTVLLNHPRWHIREKLATLQQRKVDVAELREFVRVSVVSQASRVDTLVCGNVTRDTAVRMSEDVWRRFSFDAGWGARTPPRVRVGRLPAGFGNTTVLDLDARDPANVNCAVELVAQVGVETPRLAALVALFVSVAREPCFNRLRTQEQLGYIVDLGSRRDGGCVLGVRVIVQSSVGEWDHVARRIRAFFVEELHGMLADMPREDFERHVASCAGKLLERDLTLEAESSRWWGEIEEETMWFSRAVDVATEVRRITPPELLGFFREFFGEASDARRWMVVGVRRGRVGEPQQPQQPPQQHELPVDATRGEFAFPQVGRVLRTDDELREWKERFETWSAGAAVASL